jgi:hypothetical protein
MEEQIRSADFMVTTALADKQILDDLKTDTEGTLKKLSADAIRMLPDKKTTNWIWIIVVISFALVMVYSAWILGSGVTREVVTNPVTKSDTILTVFMTVVGFLAGLLSPSPVSSKNT